MAAAAVEEALVKGGGVARWESGGGPKGVAVGWSGLKMK